MNENSSPEERLLHLIKGKKEPPASEESPVAKEEIKIEINPAPESLPQQKEEKPAAKKNIPAEMPIPKPKIPNPVKAKQLSFNISHLYIIITILLVGLVSFFAFNIFSNDEKEELERMQALIASLSEAVETAGTEETKELDKQEPEVVVDKPKPNSSFDEYQKLLNEKTIFAPPVTSKRKEKVKEGPGLRELIKEIRLVGIMPGDEPQAIIEDKKSGQTLFLIKGESIGDIQIRDISSGKVVLGYGEETMALSL
ncbi:MAG: hypothetical protein HQ572_05130 [Candidatus Omnitrophica bacterium]|nr:hypothetical protein [Candidatus Omnitrophota bacterium]